MKTKKLFIGIISALLGLMMVISCDKLNDNISGEDIEIAEDEAFADLVFEDLMNEIDAVEAGITKSTENEGCATITTTVVDTVWTITIDYGDGCEQLIQNRFGVTVDTIVRKGKVIIERKGRYLQKGSYRTVTLLGYSVNGMQIEGTRTVENKGLDENNHMWFSIILQNGKITTPDGIEITRNSERERHWVAGAGTPSILDDEYKVWGTVTGNTASGEAYSCTTIDSLYIKLVCRLITGGKVEIAVGDREPVVLDYGNGECDATATLTRDGESKQITLRYRPRLKVLRVIRFFGK
ncbi:MAG: hypothetical protein JXB00_00110 [Bacteroidales bacterium]|nr:hypothetical protein [Bacteroidales bacterium]